MSHCLPRLDYDSMMSLLAHAACRTSSDVSKRVSYVNQRHRYHVTVLSPHAKWMSP